MVHSVSLTKGLVEGPMGLDWLRVGVSTTHVKRYCPQCVLGKRTCRGPKKEYQPPNNPEFMGEWDLEIIWHTFNKVYYEVWKKWESLLTRSCSKPDIFCHSWNRSPFTEITEKFNKFDQIWDFLFVCTQVWFTGLICVEFSAQSHWLNVSGLDLLIKGSLLASHATQKGDEKSNEECET